MSEEKKVYKTLSEAAGGFPNLTKENLDKFIAEEVAYYKLFPEELKTSDYEVDYKKVSEAIKADKSFSECIRKIATKLSELHEKEEK